MIMKDEEEILDDTMPRWVSDYIAFHNEIRSRFPGAQLFTDPEAPKILMRICLGLCGGLNDRLGHLSGSSIGYPLIFIWQIKLGEFSSSIG